MVNIWGIVKLGLVASVMASPIVSDDPSTLDSRSPLPGRGQSNPDCGKYSFVFTGLPWNHPAVKASGFTPQQVEAGIRSDMKAIVQAGYNIKAVLVGPENPIGDIASELKGVEWTGTGVGHNSVVPGTGTPSPDSLQLLTQLERLGHPAVFSAPGLTGLLEKAWEGPGYCDPLQSLHSPIVKLP
ncbi:hypothetical protein CH063_07578 [Colletotrichum higginsianum]|uniref:Uncharacterized protein n=1 Tax=Colletotrichum higginsianum (strain IMI 349063) TaxID=759273 RepID=H1V6N5_COLHI|nr:hypothetical protein CH63R_01330 [Colletotrichum higginsianum IMI 349063]OBR16150.1 hypothetical protein CH63R_01330 [Colletotrichum higginsianum IMI 349063]CCF35887.1 hypothetical protein CH063_07578 [Colletotrichum higginsianum]